MNLQSLGWNEFFENQRKEKELDTRNIGRVVFEQKSEVVVSLGSFEVKASSSGNLIKSESFPKIGDWVVFMHSPEKEKKNLIENILERKSELKRIEVGRKNEKRRKKEQIIAANVDVLVAVLALDAGFKMSKLERFVMLAYANRITPMIVLTKRDLCENADEKIEKVVNRFPELKVETINALQERDVEKFSEHIYAGKTFILVGPSGVGKSTIVNQLMKDNVQKTASVRSDDSQGRHTTTSRQLFVVPGGGLLIDTPGIREIAIDMEKEDLAAAFEEIDYIAQKCKFRNCTHTHEPGCAVKKAVEDRILAQEKLDAYLKLS